MTLQALATHLEFGVFLFVLSALLTRLMIRLNIADRPNHRSSHAHATPKSGGLAIAVAYFFGIVVLFVVSQAVRVPAKAFAAYLAIAGALLGMSLADDLFELKPLWKLLGQLFCAAAFVTLVARVDDLHLPWIGLVHLGPVGAIGTALWIVVMMNIVNFMDGINGLVSGCTLITTMVLGAMAALYDAPLVYLSCIVLFAAVLGFFVFNFPGGRIFLGDTGSQFCGFVLASLAVIGNTSEGGHLALYVVPCLVFPLLFDASVTLFRRWRRGARLSEAHREHLYQILTRAGLSHVQVSAIYFGLTLACVGPALIVQMLPADHDVWALIGLLPGFVLFAVWVYRYGARHGVVLGTPSKSG